MLFFICVMAATIAVTRVNTLENTDHVFLNQWTPTYLHINVACSNITTQDGFKFQLQCPAGNEITVYHNKTVIATARLGNKSINKSEVASIDDTFITMKECRDIQINCITESTGQYVTEKWVIYATEKIKDTDPDFTKWIWILLPVPVIIAVSLVSLCLYISWRRKIKEKQGAATERLQTRQTRPHEGHGDLEDKADDVQIKISVDEVQSATDSSGSHEKKQDTTLGAVPTSNVANQTTKMGHIAGPEEASHHRPMNRNLRDDPGGVNDDKDKGNARSHKAINSGCFLRYCGPATHKTEEQLLLLNQRATIQGSDMMERVTCDQSLLKETELDTDVESMLKLKNCKYSSA